MGFEMDDKNLAIICLTLIVIIAFLRSPQIAEKVVISVVSAIAGLVTGRMKG